MEPRARAEENADEGGTRRTPSREGASHDLDCVRQAARLKEERFTHPRSVAVRVSRPTIQGGSRMP
jgi:hypothetical protein